MAVSFNYNLFSKTEKEELITKLCIFYIEPKIKTFPHSFYDSTKFFKSFYLDEKKEFIFIPKFFQKQFFPLKKINEQQYRNYSMNNQIIEKIILKEEQEKIKKNTIVLLEKFESCILSLYCGFGKTILSLCVSFHFKMKTLIIVNKIILLKQWKKEIEDFFPNAKIKECSSQPDKNFSEDYDFYIINCQNLIKYKDKFSFCPFVICDEIHQLMTEKNTLGFLNIFPKYFLGLSATPYRNDEKNILINYFFGNEKNTIFRSLKKDHDVFVINTKIFFHYDYLSNNQINWTELITQQSQDCKRNNIIVNIVKKFNNIKFLILVKRIEHGIFLEKEMKNFTSVTTLLGKNQEYDPNARILIGTTQKIGTGFNEKNIQGLILGTDVKEYFIQYLGRIFRNSDLNPVVFDLVDSDQFNIFKKHFNERKISYNSIGAKYQFKDPSFFEEGQMLL